MQTKSKPTTEITRKMGRSPCVKQIRQTFKLNQDCTNSYVLWIYICQIENKAFIHDSHPNFRIYKSAQFLSSAYTSLTLFYMIQS